MHSKRQHKSGFTLIELMVVIILISLLAGIVGPLTYKQVSRAQANSEYLLLRSSLKNYTAMAFAQGLSFQIQMKGDQFTARSALGERSHQFARINLPDRTFMINSNGYPSIALITFDVAGIARQITLADMLGVKQDSIYAKR